MIKYYMTINQAINGGREPKHKKIDPSDIFGCFRRGRCLKVTTMKPKKPNSAIRKVARVKLSTQKEVWAYIPGIKHNLQEHSMVMVRPGRTQDLPGLKYKVVRGVLDAQPVANRQKAPSKYGVSMEARKKAKAAPAAKKK